MKIVSLKELCEMGSGTIFQSFSPMCLGDLMILGGYYRNKEGEFSDFTQAPLLPNAEAGSSFASDEPPLPDGTPIKEDGFYIVTPSGYGRWGLYEKDARFLVLEKEDRERLATWLLNPSIAVKSMNDGVHAIVEVQI